MAIITGNTGNVAITGNFSAAVINVVEWSGNLDNEFFDSRVFDGTGTNGVEEYRGPYQFIGTITGYLDGTAVPTIAHFNVGATAGTLTLTASTSRTYIFDAHVHNWAPSVHRFQGLNAYSCSFRSKGNITTIG